MKILRNLVCTVLVTMTMAVAMDDGAAELDRDGDRSVVHGVTDKSTEVPIERATDGEEGTRRGCGRPGCLGCNGMSLADFLATGMNGDARNGQTNSMSEILEALEMTAFLNVLLRRDTSTTTSDVVGEDTTEGGSEEGDTDAAPNTERTSFLGALLSGRVVILSVSRHVTTPASRAETTGSQQPSTENIV